MSPTQNSNSTMTWAVVGGVVVLVAAAIGAVYARYVMSRESAELDVAAQERAARRAPCAKIAAVPWAEARKALLANEPGATAAWAERCSRLSGVVAELARDGTYVLIAGDAETPDLTCAPVDRELTLTLVRGQTITVSGFGQPKRGPRFELRDCDWTP